MWTSLPVRMTPRRQSPPLLALLLWLSLAQVLGLKNLKTEQVGTGACRAGEVEYRRGDDVLCYGLTPKLPFARALAACRATGGRLATIYSQEHNDLLYAMLSESAYIGAVARKHMLRHPLGNVGPGVIWSWLSGEQPEYTNVLPFETRGFYKQPDGGGFEGCMELMKHSVLTNDAGNRFWGDTDCRARKPAICVRKGYFARPVIEGEEQPWELELQRGQRASCPEGFSRVGVRRSDEGGTRSTCLSRRQAAENFTMASQVCQQLDATATIARPSKLAGRRRWIPSHSDSEMRLFWAGADRRNAEVLWRWRDSGRRVSHHSWAAGEPHDREFDDCAAFDPARRGMVATSCDTELEFVCETLPPGCASGYFVSATGLECVRHNQEGCEGSEDYTGEPNERACTARLCPVGCPSGFSQLGLLCLMVNDTASWAADVLRSCLSRMMTPIQPRNTEENEFLRRQAERIGRPLWIEATSAKKFSRWHKYVSYGLPHEPNEPASCGECRREPLCSILWFDGEWMDVDCFSEFPSVCAAPIAWDACAGGVEELKSTKKGISL